MRGDPTRARFIRPEGEANSARAKATTVRREVEMFRTLSPVEAAARIEAQQAEVERARQLEAERGQQLRGVIGSPERAY